MAAGFALTKSRTLYHWYVPHVPEGDDPLEQLLLGRTRCDQEVTAIVSHNTRPSPISAHADVSEAILAGLYCGHCWQGTDTAEQLEALRKL